MGFHRAEASRAADGPFEFPRVERRRDTGEVSASGAQPSDQRQKEVDVHQRAVAGRAVVHAQSTDHRQRHPRGARGTAQIRGRQHPYAFAVRIRAVHAFTIVAEKQRCSRDRGASPRRSRGRSFPFYRHLAPRPQDVIERRRCRAQLPQPRQCTARDAPGCASPPGSESARRSAVTPLSSGTSTSRASASSGRPRVHVLPPGGREYRRDTSPSVASRVSGQRHLHREVDRFRPWSWVWKKRWTT